MALEHALKHFASDNASKAACERSLKRTSLHTAFEALLVKYGHPRIVCSLLCSAPSNRPADASLRSIAKSWEARFDVLTKGSFTQRLCKYCSGWIDLGYASARAKASNPPASNWAVAAARDS